MAYVDFTGAYPIARLDRPRPAARFSALEWSVVMLARLDSVAGLREPGRIARAFGSLFGLGRESRLADTRLEALRRAAVHAWHGAGGLDAGERAAFHDAGFTPAQLSILLASVGADGRRSSLHRSVAA